MEDEQAKPERFEEHWRERSDAEEAQGQQKYQQERALETA